jgi:hypothetical protein
LPEDDIDGLARVIREAAHSDLATMGAAARRSADGHLDASLNAWRALSAELLGLQTAKAKAA